MNTRLVRGFLWGVVATVAMTIVHLGIWAAKGRLSIQAMATRMMPSVVITRFFGSRLPVSTHLLLAALIHLGYGGFWGAVLFGIVNQVTFWKGLAMGGFLYLCAHLLLVPMLGSEATGTTAIESAFAFWISWFSISTHLTYGATLGLLGGWQDHAVVSARSKAPASQVQRHTAHSAPSR